MSFWGLGLPLLLNDRPRGDESSIDFDNDTIIRRISRVHHCVSNGKGGSRISSLAFEPSSEDRALSVDLEECINRIPRDPKDFVRSPDYVGAVWIAGEVLVDLGFLYISDPISNENPCHALVFGVFSRSKKRSLLKNAHWYNEIPGVDLSE